MLTRMRRPIPAAVYGLCLALWVGLGLAALALLFGGKVLVEVMDVRAELWSPTGELVSWKTDFDTVDAWTDLRTRYTDEGLPPGLLEPGARFLWDEPSDSTYLQPPLYEQEPEVAWRYAMVAHASGGGAGGALRGVALEEPSGEATAFRVALHDGGRWRISGSIAVPSTAGASWGAAHVLVWSDGTLLLLDERNPGFAWIGSTGGGWRQIARPAEASTGTFLPGEAGRALAFTSSYVTVWNLADRNARIVARPDGAGEHFLPVLVADGRVAVFQLDGPRADFSAGWLAAMAALIAVLVGSIFWVRRRYELPATAPINTWASRDAGIDLGTGMGLGALAAFGLLFLVAFDSRGDGVGLFIAGGLAISALVVWIVMLFRRARHTSVGGLVGGVALGGIIGLFMLLMVLADIGEISFGGGRPSRRAGRPVLPRLTRARRRDAAGSVVGGRLTRWFCRRYFTHAARLEASSVPTFERLARELAEVGAPSCLVARARSAAADEVRHARTCIDLAARHGPVPTLAPMPAEAERVRALGHPDLLVRLALESLEEGCLGEGFAAAAARHSAASARAPEVAEALRRLADDESRHAELAWDVLAFCLDQGGARTRAAVAAWTPARSRVTSRGLRGGRSTRHLAAEGLFVEAVPGALARAVTSSVGARVSRLCDDARRASSPA